MPNASSSVCFNIQWLLCEQACSICVTRELTVLLQGEEAYITFLNQWVKSLYIQKMQWKLHLIQPLPINRQELKLLSNDRKGKQINLWPKIKGKIYGIHWICHTCGLNSSLSSTLMWQNADNLILLVLLPCFVLWGFFSCQCRRVSLWANSLVLISLTIYSRQSPWQKSIDANIWDTINCYEKLYLSLITQPLALLSVPIDIKYKLNVAQTLRVIKDRNANWIGCVVACFADTYITARGAKNLMSTNWLHKMVTPLSVESLRYWLLKCLSISCCASFLPIAIGMSVQFRAHFWVQTPSSFSTTVRSSWPTATFPSASGATRGSNCFPVGKSSLMEPRPSIWWSRENRVRRYKTY